MQLGYPEFEAVMKAQLKLFVQRQLSNALISGAGSRFEVTIHNKYTRLYIYLHLICIICIYQFICIIYICIIYIYQFTIYVHHIYISIHKYTTIYMYI